MTPIPVELQQSGLSEAVTIAIPAVAAVIVAFIAAITAGRRQQRALAAEQSRLETQLAHDRGVHDLDGLRQLLDDASGLMMEAVHAHTDLMTAVHGQAGQLSQYAFEEAAKAIDRAQQVQSAFTPLAGRMLVHFDEDAPVFVALNEHLGVFHKGIVFYLAGPPPEKLWPTLHEHILEAKEHAVEFRAQARLLVAFRPSQPVGAPVVS